MGITDYPQTYPHIVKRAVNDILLVNYVIKRETLPFYSHSHLGVEKIHNFDKNQITFWV